MNKIIGYFVGYVRFSFCGGFVDEFLDKAYKGEIILYDIKLEGDVLFASCLPKDYKKLHKVAYLCGGKVKIISRYGFIFQILRLFNRWGVVLGLIIGIGLASLISGFVWQINIVGNNALSDEVILDFLAEQDFRYGTFWMNVDKDILEDKMMASFEEVAWVHINRFGTVAQVEIQEATQKPEMVDLSVVTNLKATKDGVITYARVYDGWQQKKIGDSVVKGDILVSGVYESEHANENMFAHARGMFIARVEEDFSLTVSREQWYRDYEEEKTYRALSIFGIYIPLYLGAVPSQDAEIETKMEFLTINDNHIPIALVSHKVKKYVEVSRVLNDNELYELCQDNITKELNDKYNAEDIISKDIDITIELNNASAKGVVVVSENIGEEVNFISKEQEND